MVSPGIKQWFSPNRKKKVFASRQLDGTWEAWELSKIGNKFTTDSFIAKGGRNEVFASVRQHITNSKRRGRWK